MAVQDATPKKIMPAMYLLADCGSTNGANTDWKNSTPRAALVKGLIGLLMTSVSTSPRGFLHASLTANQSIWIIMGLIITHLNTPPLG